jgi:hypothetical protein
VDAGRSSGELSIPDDLLRRGEWPFSARTGLMQRSKMTCAKGLFDHIGGEREQRRRYRETQRRRSLKIDHKLELGR